MAGASPSESQLTDSLPAQSHTSPLSQALTSERAERREEGRRCCCRDGSTGTQSKGLGANGRKKAKEREAAKPPSASRLGEWGTWVSGRF